MAVNTLNLTIGAGEVATSFRSIAGAPQARVTATVKTGTTPTTTKFTAVTAEAAKISVGDYLQLTSAAATATNEATEASGLPRVTSIVANGSDFDINVSPAFASAPTAGSASVTVMYEDRGSTTGPIELAIETTLTMIEVEQLGDPVEAIRTARKVTMKIPLAEATYENLAFVMGDAPPAAGATSMNVGALTPAAARADRVVFRTPAPNGAFRYYVFNRAVSEANATMSSARAAQSSLEATLTMLADSTMGPGKEMYTAKDA